jgi:hypothetical protein
MKDWEFEKIAKGKYKGVFLRDSPIYAKKFYPNAYNTKNDENYARNMIVRYLLPFSLFKIYPSSQRKYVYMNGRWNNNSIFNSGWIASYIRELALMKSLPDISEATNSNRGNYNFFSSLLTHDVYAARDNGQVQTIVQGGKKTKNKDHTTNDILMNDSSIPKKDIVRFGNGKTAVHFYSAKESMVQIAKWIKWMKNNGVYNNTKIIVVSDHGYDINNPMFKQNKSKEGVVYSRYNPILLVKEFDATGELKINNKFITNADVVAMSLETIDKNAKTKYTHNKDKGFRLYTGDKNTSLMVYKNIFEPTNWKYTKVK